MDGHHWRCQPCCLCIRRWSSIIVSGGGGGDGWGLPRRGYAQGVVGDGERGGGDGRRWVARLVVPTLDDSDVLGGADVARLPKRLRGMSHPAATLSAGAAVAVAVVVALQLKPSQLLPELPSSLPLLPSLPSMMSLLSLRTCRALEASTLNSGGSGKVGTTCCRDWRTCWRDAEEMSRGETGGVLDTVCQPLGGVGTRGDRTDWDTVYKGQLRATTRSPATYRCWSCQPWTQPKMQLSGVPPPSPPPHPPPLPPPAPQPPLPA